MGRVGEGGGLRLEREREETVSTNTENKAGPSGCCDKDMHVLIHTTVLLPRVLKQDTPEHA